jgi:hypothetical protein
MTDSVGPVYTGRFEEFVIDDGRGEQYTILFLADRNNDALQREGKPPSYYWVPGGVRLSRRGDVGDYKFRQVHFVGVLDENQHVGAAGNSEVAGGVLSFTTTSRYPTEILKQATDQLLDRFRGDDDRYWGWRTSAAPQFAMVPITANATVVTNLAPDRSGSAPAENLGPAAPAAPAGGGNGSAAGASAPRSLVRYTRSMGRVEHGRNAPSSNVDAWAFRLQGQGPGSVTGGENAYSGLIGALPSEIVWAGFHGGYSPMVVAQSLIMPMWSQELWLKITGSWDRIFEHFSTHANGGYRWFSADIKAEFNNLRLSGGIKVELAVDGTLPQGPELEKAIDERIDLVTQKFMEEATRVIFEPAMPEVEPAQAPSGGLFSRLLGWGDVGLALKYRRDTTRLNLQYEETRYHRYNQPTTISSSLEGFAAEIAADPESERKYFQRLILGDLSRKVTRIVKPVVNWPSPERDWVGEPVSFMSTQIGYPDENGVLQWTPRVFQSTDTGPESTWQPAFVRRNADEVANAPAGWQPDVAFVKRKVHLREPAGGFANPNVRMLIERNEIDLDPGETGTATRDQVLEVRADNVGVLEVGPITLGVVLQDATQVVEVVFRPEGTTLDGGDREQVRFSWRHDDQDQPRYLKIFTGDLEYTPVYSYQVRVIVRGSIFAAGMEWEGPWVEGQGNGPLMVSIPTPDDAGVRRVRREPRELALSVPPTAGDGAAPAAAAAVTRPPGEARAPAEPREAGEEREPVETVSGYELATEMRTAVRSARRAPARPAETAEPTAPADADLALTTDGWHTG